MKIGVLTFHAGLNHGGFLQAHAMQTFLTSLGHEVVVLNYQNPAHRRHTQHLPWVIPQRSVTWWRHFRKWKAFRSDFQAMNISVRLNTRDEIASLGLDAVVVGSDIVWNLELFGVDLTYFADFPVPFRVAYAPSFGWMDSSTSLPAEVVRCLKNFDHILVRDERSQQILLENLGVEFPLVVDPTLLQPTFGTGVSGVGGDKLVVYAHGLLPKWQESVGEFATRKRLSILSTGYPTGLPGRLALELGPFAWVDAVQNAGAIVTNTFHGTIFASLSGRPYVSIWKRESASRIESYLSQIGSVDRLIQDPADLETFLSRPPPLETQTTIRALASSSRERFHQALAQATGGKEGSG